MSWLVLLADLPFYDLFGIAMIQRPWFRVQGISCGDFVVTGPCPLSHEQICIILGGHGD